MKHDEKKEGQEKRWRSLSIAVVALRRWNKEEREVRDELRADKACNWTLGLEALCLTCGDLRGEVELRFSKSSVSIQSQGRIRMHPRDVHIPELSQLDAAEIARRLERLAQLEKLVGEYVQPVSATGTAPPGQSASAASEAHASDPTYMDLAAGVPNRAAFEDRLNAFLHSPAANAEAAAVMLVSIDRISQLRSALGFSACDRLLRAVGQRLRQVVRGTDLVARVTDECFAVLLTQMRLREDAAVVARKFKQVLDAPFQIEQQSLRLITSIGIAVVTGEESGADTLLVRADNAMRCARERGDGQFQFFHEGMSEQVSQQLSLEVQLRAAIEQHRFINHYQPRFDLRTGVCIGAEALVRWLHPERGTLYPAEFLDVAKSTGLIVPLGVQVLRQACMDAVRWSGQGVIAVNISAREFHGNALIASVRKALLDSGLPAQRLQLEVTEDSLRCMGGENERCSMMLDVVESLSTLRAMGVRVALDDFGAGVASLSTLHNYDIDAIKIDT